QHLQPSFNLIPLNHLGRSPSAFRGRVVTVEGNMSCTALAKVLLLKVTDSPRRPLHSQKASQSTSHITFSFGPSSQHSRTNVPIIEVEALSFWTNAIPLAG